MTTQTLPCLLLPINEMNIILPSAAIVEIIPFEKTEVIPDIPKWLVGILLWRGVHIPLTHLNKIESHLAWNNRASVENHGENTKGFHIAIVNRVKKLKGNEGEKMNKYPFFSIVLAGTPKLYRITHENIKMIAKAVEGDARLLMEVKIQSDSAFVPNLVSLWDMIDELPSRLQWFRQIIL